MKGAFAGLTKRDMMYRGGMPEEVGNVRTEGTIRHSKLTVVAQYKRIILFVALFAFSTNGYPQIVGVTWQAKSIGIEMTLFKDGTYRFLSPAGETTGWYLLSGEILQMQDAMTGAISVYRIQETKPGVLVMTDSFGGTIQMTAAGNEATAVVLAEARGYRLTEADVAVGFDLISLVIDAPLTENEKSRLRKKAIEEFKSYPAEFLQQVTSLRQALHKLRSLRDPQQVGLARQTLFAELYFASKSIPDKQRPEIIRIINEHVQVVAEDSTNKLLLTDRDLDAFLSYGDFIARFTGTTPLTAQLNREYLRKLLREQYASLPLQTKQGLAAVYSVWQAIEKVWPDLTSEQQQQIMTQYRSAMTSSLRDPSSKYAPILTNPEAMSQASPQEIYNRSMASMRQSVMQGWFRQNTFLNTMNAAAGYGTSFWPSPFSN
jgi:hypothetical protein